MKEKAAEPGIQKIIFVGLCFILLLTGLLYRSSLKGEFLSYDDTENVVNNPLVRNLSIAGLPQFFQAGKLYMYTPLTFLSYAVDYQLGGMDPFQFRLSNLILHLVNILLVFIFARQFLKQGYLALLVALLFAIHPMNADSVAWISARSNLLSGTFILLSLIFYCSYSKNRKYRYLVFSILAYLFSLLSKSSGVLLPFFLFLFDSMAGRKWSVRILMEKIPYLAIGLLIGLITLFIRADTGNTQSVISYSVVDRIFMVFYSLDGYLFRSILPFGLSEIYAYPVKSSGLLPFLYYLSPVIIIALFLYFFKRRSTLPKQFLFCLLFFLLLILPTQAALLEDGFMANRYGYIPLAGIFLLLVFFAGHLVSRFSIHRKWMLVMILPALLFSVVTHNRAQSWTNTLALLNHTLSRSPDAAFAYNLRGLAKYSGNDLEGAMGDYDAALRLNPAYAGCYYNRGIVFYNRSEFDRALQDYSKALSLNPGFSSCYDARGILYMDVLHNDSLALADYNLAIRYNPGFAQAYFNRGLLMLRRQNREAACNDFHKVKALGFSQADELIDKYCR